MTTRYLLLLLLFPALLFAQQDKLKRIDSLLSYYESKNEWMGSVAISDNGKVIFSKAYGLSDVSIKKRPDANTGYKIGSITKMFTSAIVFQLIENGKLTLDTKLAKYYPQIPNSDKITIVQLLGHRSGLFNYTDDTTVVNSWRNPISKAVMLDKIKSYQSLFAPGTRSQYSNSNYYLLGLIIEDITKISYSANVQDRIIKKLGLKRTIYPDKPDPAHNEALSYKTSGGKWVLEEPWDHSFASSAGALVGTPSDLTVFIQALFDGKIISESSLAEMTKIEDGYGRGIFPIPFYEKKGYGHTGGIEQFASSVAYFPTEKVAISMVANAKGENNNDIAIGILSLYFEKPYTFPNLDKVIVDTKILKSYEGVYSSPTFPLKIEISESNGTLTAQATGQPALTLETINESEFAFKQAGANFTLGNNKLTLKQAGATFELTKE
jgi:CubicO group peptidase (beta-lactamase class C family)